MSDQNPYSAPAADVSPETSPSSYTLHDPRPVPAGRGMSWISEGFDLYKKDWLPWIGVCVVGFILMIIFSMIPIVNILVYFTTYIWIGGLLLGCKAQNEGEPMKVSYLFAGFSGGHFLPLLLLSAVVWIVNLALGALAFGSIYFQLMGTANEEAVNELMANPGQLLLPALIWIALLLPVIMATWFAPALVVINQTPVFKAMAMSFKGCLKNILPFLIYGIVLLILMLVGSIPLMLGLLVVVPLTYTSIFCSYKDIYID